VTSSTSTHAETDSRYWPHPVHVGSCHCHRILVVSRQLHSGSGQFRVLTYFLGTFNFTLHVMRCSTDYNVGNMMFNSQAQTTIGLRTYVMTHASMSRVRGKVVPVLTQLSTMPSRRMGSGCIYPRFLDLGTSWWWVVSFTPLLLYPRGKSLRYPLDRRLGGPQSRSGRHGEVIILASNGTRTPTPWSSSS
jgi:hypothetical protein